MADRTSILSNKGGRFGNARDGSITPGLVFNSNPQAKNDRGFGSRREGSGNVVTDVYYDSSTNEIVTVMGAAAAPRKILVIVGGNTLSAGVPGIRYAAGPVVATSVYDPDVDTVYPDGVGNALLYINGVLQTKKVLVRHNYAAAQGAVVGGLPLRVFGSESLIFTPASDPPVTLSCLTFEWPGEG